MKIRQRLFLSKEYKGNSRIIVNMNDKIPVFVNKDADIKQLELIEDYDESSYI